MLLSLFHFRFNFPVDLAFALYIEGLFLCMEWNTIFKKVVICFSGRHAHV